MIVTRLALPRRTLLRGVGVALGLPLLEAMVPVFPVRAAARPVHRFGLIYVPNGMHMSSFVPKTDGEDYQLSPILAPLAPHRNHFVVVTGCSNLQAEAL